LYIWRHKKKLDRDLGIMLGHATGVDNESIDADLARAYANEY
jgi:2-phosphoglycerate kinase